MAKRQKLSSYQLDDLPVEVILKILDFLDIKELLLCGQVSKQLRAIANDESLWLKLNLYERKVPYDFIEKAVGNGCQYLSLVGCDILSLTGKSESSLNLKFLNLYGGCQGVQKLVQNCSSLQKLSVAWLTLDSDDIQYVCQSGQTLQVLDLEECHFDLHNLTESLTGLFTNCAHLTELNIGDNELLDPHIQALVDNLTPTILKVNLNRRVNLKIEHVKTLVRRCNNITHLDLRRTFLTNDAVHSIIKYLRTSMEKLDVSDTEVNFATLLQLKSMPALKTLICFYLHNGGDHAEDIKNLKQHLPHVSVNDEKYFLIASPLKKKNECISYLVFCNQWIWEIRAKEQNLFAKQHRKMLTKNEESLLRIPTDQYNTVDILERTQFRLRNDLMAAIKNRARKIWKKRINIGP